MLLGNKIVVVLPAYNAARTLERTYREIPLDIVDEVVLVDDASADDTLAVARALGITHVIHHDANRGYGGNQKTCYDAALAPGADIVVMLHPDYQYTPRLVRRHGRRARRGRLRRRARLAHPGQRRAARAACRSTSTWPTARSPLFENILIGAEALRVPHRLSRLSRRVLESIPYRRNSDDFVFDNQMLVQAHALGFRIAELTCPTKYFAEASSTNFRQSLRYGILCCATAAQYRLHRMGVLPSRLFERKGSAPDTLAPADSRR